MTVAVVLAVAAILFMLQPSETHNAPTEVVPSNPVSVQSIAADKHVESSTGNELPATEEPDCPDYAGPTDRRLGSEDVHDALQNAASELRLSSNPEHRLAAGIILANDAPEEAFDLMQDTATTHSTSAIASWRSLILCGQRDVPACASTAVEENAILADRDNGMMWVQLASRRLDSGREQDAVDAIRHAIAAPRFDTYFTDQIELMDRSLAAVLSWSFGERVVHGSDNVAVSPANFGFIRARCDNAPSGIWPELCDQLGQRMVSENVDLQSKILGSSLRVGVLETIGDVSGAAAVEAELDALNAQQDLLGSDVSLLNLILSDDTVLRDYLSVSQSYGEEEALSRLSEQAARLRATPGYNQCNFLTNPYIRF